MERSKKHRYSASDSVGLISLDQYQSSPLITTTNPSLVYTRLKAAWFPMTLIPPKWVFGASHLKYKLQTE